MSQLLEPTLGGDWLARPSKILLSDIVFGCSGARPLASLRRRCAACGRPPDSLTFSGSVLGAEGEIVRRQVARFEAEHGVRVEVRPTPDAADQRHQLYVQWLNAWSADPDILQLDVVWTPEFAAAGWIRPVDEFRIPQETLADFFDATLRANHWGGRLYAVPWFVDTGMLYWRTDLMTRRTRKLRRAQGCSVTRA